MKQNNFFQVQIMALLLSFATWKVQISGLDDAKPIIVSTYVTSLVLAVVIVSTYTLSEYINAYAAVFGVGFFLGTTLILGLVFMTKVRYNYMQHACGVSWVRIPPVRHLSTQTLVIHQWAGPSVVAQLAPDSTPDRAE